VLLRLGYFPDLESAHTILFGGDRAGLDRLAALLTPLTAPGAQAVELHDYAQVSVWKPVRLTAMCDAADHGVQRQRVVQGIPTFIWQCSEAGWREILELLAEVREMPTTGHRLLDSPEADGEVAIMVSTEYSEVWWESHG
jgi:hypothetical protein